MSKYIKFYPNEALFAAVLQQRLELPNISFVDATGKTYCMPEKSWGLTIPVDGSTDYTLVGNVAAWNNYKAKIGRYLLKSNGDAYKLNVYDSTILDYNDATFDPNLGNVMVRIPRLSYMVVRDSTGRDTIWMTEEPVMRNVIEEQWVGAYLASYYGNKLRSMKGETVAASRTINTFWDQAQANGKAFGLTNYTQRILMVLIYLSNYRSLNSQATLGYGMNGNAGNFAAAQNKPTGETSSIGDACGSVDGGTANANAKHISLFGLEDIYGWYWEMIQGAFLINNKVYVYDGNRMPDSEELAYGAKGKSRSFNRNASEGWITKLVGGEHFDILPSAVGGGSSSYWCDYTYTASNGQLLLCGGASNVGAISGIVSSGSDNAWTAELSYFGSRLAYYGKANILK